MRTCPAMGSLKFCAKCPASCTDMSSSEVTKEASVHGNKTFERALERGVKQLVAVKLPVWVWHAIFSCVMRQ
jgi:hypothetical protein